MLFRTSFAVVFQFADDHIFRRSERYGFTLELDWALKAKSPSLQLVSPG